MNPAAITIRRKKADFHHIYRRCPNVLLISPNRWIDLRDGLMADAEESGSLQPLRPLLTDPHTYDGMLVAHPSDVLSDVCEVAYVPNL